MINIVQGEMGGGGAYWAVSKIFVQQYFISTSLACNSFISIIDILDKQFFLATVSSGSYCFGYIKTKIFLNDILSNQKLLIKSIIAVFQAKTRKIFKQLLVFFYPPASEASRGVY